MLSREELRVELKAWLKEHPEKRETIGLYLGGSHPIENILSASGLGKVPFRVRRAVEELVTAPSIEAVMELRFRQRLEASIAQATSHHREFGSAPDGGLLSDWVRGQRKLLAKTYGVTIELSANELRRLRTQFRKAS